MPKKSLFYLLLTLIIITSCKKKPIDISKVAVLGNAALNLETLDFNEDVLKLYSKISEIDSLESLFDGRRNRDPFLIEDLEFKIFEIPSHNIFVPKYIYGYVFKGKEKDSLAQFHDMYFNQIESLTNKDKKIVAINATSIYRDKSKRDAQLDSITKFYGSPILKVATASDFNQNSYSWVTKNKIIEIRTSYGFSFKANTSGESSSYKTYKLELLLVDTKQLEALVDAHRHFYDENLQHTYTPQLAGSKFLPELINIKKYYLDNTGQYHVNDD